MVNNSEKFKQPLDIRPVADIDVTYRALRILAEEKIGEQTEAQKAVLDYYLHKNVAIHVAAGHQLAMADEGQFQINTPSTESLARAFMIKKMDAANAVSEDNKYKTIRDVDEGTRKEWFKEFLEDLEHVHPFIFNNTMHPTFTSTKEVLDAEAQMTKQMRLDMQGLLDGRIEREIRQENPDSSDEDIAKKMAKKMKELSPETIGAYQNNAGILNIELNNPPEKGMTARNELALNIRQSRHSFNAVPEYAVTLGKIGKRLFGVGIEATEIREAIVRTTAESMRAEAWLSDQDDKPQMNPVQFRKALRMDVLAINQKYIREFAGIAVKLDDGDAKEEFKKSMEKLFNTIVDYYQSPDHNGYQKNDGEHVGDKLERFVESIITDSKEMAIADDKGVKYIRAPIISPEVAGLIKAVYEGIKKNILEADVIKEGAFNKESLGQRLEELADMEGVRDVKHVNLSGEVTDLSAIDALRTQQKPFGEVAQTITQRQNSRVYDNLRETVLERINEEFSSGVEGNFDIKGLIKILYDAEKKEMITDGLAMEIRKFIQKGVSRSHNSLENIYKEFDEGTKAGFTPDEYKELYCTDGMLWMIQETIYAGDKVERNLIAETEKPEDTLTVMAAQLLMAIPGKEPKISDMAAIDPLVEYTEDIQKFPKIMKDSLQNELLKSYMQAHSEGREQKYLKIRDKTGEMGYGTAEDHLMLLAESKGRTKAAEFTEEERGGLSDKKITELAYKESVAFYNHAIEIMAWAHDIDMNTDNGKSAMEKILKQDVKTSTTIMGAGSDSNKSSSKRFGTQYKDAFEDASLVALSHGIMTIEKKGNGTAPHRDAVNTATNQTIQGRGLGFGAVFVAAMIDGVRSMHAAVKMRLSPEMKTKTSRREGAVVNIGGKLNLSDLSTNKEQVKLAKRNAEAVDKYKEQYDGKEMSDFVEVTNLLALAIYKYGARPPTRLGDDTGVKGQRAIGFGLHMGAHFNQPHLQMQAAFADLYGSDLTGVVKQDKARLASAASYLKSPQKQDQVNSSVEGIILFQPEKGWENVSNSAGINQVERSVDKRGTVRITFKDSEGNGKATMSLGRLSRLNDDEKEELKTLIKGDAKNPEYQGKEHDIDMVVNTIISSARQDLGSTKTRRALGQLFHDLAETSIGKTQKISKMKTPRLLTIEELDDTERLIANITKLNPTEGKSFSKKYELEKNALDEVVALQHKLTHDSAFAAKFDKPAKLKDISDEEREQITKEYIEKYRPHHLHTEKTESVNPTKYLPGASVSHAIFNEGKGEGEGEGENKSKEGRCERILAKIEAYVNKTTFSYDVPSKKLLGKVISVGGSAEAGQERV